MSKRIIYIIGVISVLNNLLITFDSFTTLTKDAGVYILLRYIPNLQITSLITFIIRCLEYFIFFRI